MAAAPSRFGRADHCAPATAAAAATAAAQSGDDSDDGDPGGDEFNRPASSDSGSAPVPPGDEDVETLFSLWRRLQPDTRKFFIAARDYVVAWLWRPAMLGIPYCFECWPGAQVTAPPCRRCGSTENYWSSGQVDREQLTLFDSPRDLKAGLEHGFRPPPDPNLMAAFNQHVNDHATRYGWKLAKTEREKRGICILLGFQGTPGARIKRSDVALHSRAATTSTPPSLARTRSPARPCCPGCRPLSPS